MGLERFTPFVKANDKVVKENKDVFIYTRVSSKEQEQNKSLNTQINNANSCVVKNGFIVSLTFGGTYESASGDITRKEFMKLIETVRNAKKKPYAILINTISRFSRTGADGITLANELVQKLGVHIIEVSTGKSTETEDGKLEIYRGLLTARQENLDRLRVTIPGMKSFLEEGNWLGKAPRGYDQYGSRVSNVKLHNENQRIVINEEGKLIQQAWQWKLQGERDYVIEAKLKNLGLKNINKQFLSEMWRKPFYCGVSTNKLLEGKVVYGNWEKMISEDEFFTVQEILKAGNRKDYKKDKANPNRPLNAFICCNECGGKMSGYEVKKKGIHYYKCQICKNATINASTTKGSKGLGANELFKNLLNQYTLPSKYKDLFRTQLKFTYETLNSESTNEAQRLKKELERQQAELKTLNRRYGTDVDFDKEVYKELKSEFETTIQNISANLEKTESKISNLDKYIEVSEEVVVNINKYWASDSLDTKRRVQELVFSDGLLLDVKKRAYLTKKVNFVFALSAELTRDADGGNEKRQPFFELPSSSVAGE